MDIPAMFSAAELQNGRLFYTVMRKKLERLDKNIANATQGV